MSSYGEAGVSLAKAEEVVERLRIAVESTRTDAVEAGLGGFAGLFALDDERLLAATTDGVGTKLILSKRAGRLADAGRDLAAHCANDLLTTGAEPLFFLDYVAAESLDLAEVAELVAGAAAVCREAGCAILGGETAELPGIYREGELDFAGTMVGIVQRDKVVDGTTCRAGDVVLGLPSSGLHANGFTLVRRLVGDGPFDADLLLAPTRLYLEDVRALRAACPVRALAHVTGGGIAGNLSRVLPPGLGARIDPASWERPPVYAWLDEQGVSEDEQRRVFNLGIGYCAVVRAEDAPHAALTVIGAARGGDRGRRVGGRGVIGVLVSGRGSNLQALIDQDLPIAAVASNVAGAGALERAERAGIPTGVFELDDVRLARGARPRDERLAGRQRASSSWSAPGTCTSSRRHSSSAGRRSTSIPRSSPPFPGRRPSRTPSRPACPRRA